MLSNSKRGQTPMLISHTMKEPLLIESVHTHCMHARIKNILSERTEMPLKIDHHRPISETPLKWRFSGVSMAHH